MTSQKTVTRPGGLCGLLLRQLSTILFCLVWIGISLMGLDGRLITAVDAGGDPVSLQDAIELNVGKPVSRELAGGQSHIYRLVLTAGQCLEGTVDQRGIDLKVTLLGPARKMIYEFDSEIRLHGAERISLVAEAAGEYQLLVATKEKDVPPGEYSILETAIHPATEKDHALHRARKLKTEYGLLYREGQYEKALPLAEQVVGIYERSYQGEHQDLASAILQLAVIHHESGHYEKAGELYDRALAMFEKVLPPDHPDIARCLNSMGILKANQSEFAEAEIRYLRTVDIYEKALGPGRVELSRTLLNLGTLYRYKGEYGKAEAVLQRALRMQETRFGIDHISLAPFLNNLANLYVNKGEILRAEALFERNLKIREKQLSPEHPDLAGSLHNLATFYIERKRDYAKAEPLARRALEIWEKRLGPNHPYVAEAIYNLATLHHAKGDFDNAEKLYERALSIQINARGLVGQDVALYANSLGVLMADKGDLVKAESFYRRAQAIREQIFGAMHPSVAESLNSLARLFETKGETARAIEYRTRASVISERSIALNLAAGSEQQKRAFLTSYASESDQILSLHIQKAPTDNLARDLALTIILQRKGRTLDATSDELAALRRRLTEEDRKLLDQWQDANAQLAKWVLGGPQRFSPEEYLLKIRALESQKEKLEADISSRNAEFRTQALPVTIQAIQSILPIGAAVVEISLYRPYDASRALPEQAFGPQRYVAYVLRREGEARWVELGEAKVIDEAIEQLRQALRTPQRQDVRQLARKLDQLVLEPVRPLLGDARQVLVSPDGMLNLLPFEALVDERQRYMVNRYSFHYLTSGRDLLRLQIKQANQSEDLILANPAYGEKEASENTLAESRDIVKKSSESKADGAPQLSQSPGLQQVFFRPLPGTAGEANALRRLLPHARMLTREQATEATLKQVRSPRILHIATHGYFLRDLDLSPAAGETQRLPESTSGGEKIENPLLRSGLALAGANLRKSGPDGEEDGILTALEASGLDLWGTKLVVLSACDTGVGDVKNGEGVYGLRRALVLAGSETQVMSLWPVSDTATRDLMVDYYGRLQRGDGRGEALRQAQLQMLRAPRRRHPYYWASFIQSGEWANLDGEREQRRPAPLGGKAKSGGH